MLQDETPFAVGQNKNLAGQESCNTEIGTFRHSKPLSIVFKIPAKTCDIGNPSFMVRVPIRAPHCTTQNFQKFGDGYRACGGDRFDS